MENSFQSRNIKLKDLVLWDENARFSDEYSDSTEEELIEYFLSKKDFKISQFIEEIGKDIDLPQLEKLVVWNDNGNHIVLEGNRRLSCYKILANPQLIQQKLQRSTHKWQ